MDEVKENGQSLENEAAETKESGSQEQKDPGKDVKGPGFGIDEKGHFFVQAHMSFPYSLLQGVLVEASEFLRENHPNSMKNRAKRAEQQKIVRPGFRGFNIFGKR